MFEMFLIFTITNNAAMNILVHISFHTFASVPLGQIPRSGIAGLRENLIDIAKLSHRCSISTSGI